MATSLYKTTRLRLFCSCGKVKTKRIASFEMTEEQIKTYVKEVYDE